LGLELEPPKSATVAQVRESVQVKSPVVPKLDNTGVAETDVDRLLLGILLIIK
jgi:hypothetical protein